MCLLHLLPLELVTQIFAFACTDTGRTGCSLGLVCRAFRDVCLSTGVDLQHVSLRQLRRMRFFLEVLGRRERSTCTIRSLMLVERGRLDTEGESMTPDMRDISQTISQILATISPDHLQILAVYLPFWCTASDVPALLPVDLPHLDELILSGPYNDTSFRTSCNAVNLTRLHFLTIDRLPRDFGMYIGQITPKLTHLSICNIAQLDFGCGAMLESFSRSRAATTARQTSTRSDFPRALRQIVIGLRPAYVSSSAWGSAPNQIFADVGDLSNVITFPQDASEVDYNGSVVINPLPTARSLDGWPRDEADTFKEFKRLWKCSTSGRSDAILRPRL